TSLGDGAEETHVPHMQHVEDPGDHGRSVQDVWSVEPAQMERPGDLPLCVRLRHAATCFLMPECPPFVHHGPAGKVNVPARGGYSGEGESAHRRRFASM